MITWSDKAKRAMAVFFTPWNDIDVYVEDTAKHAKSLYSALLNNALGDKCKVERVHPLGDKKKVVDACTADQSPGGRPRIYLVDGDLDLIAGPPPQKLIRFFSHQVYAIENYLFCEHALAEFLHEENCHLSADEVKEALDMPSFIATLAPLYELFRCFAVTRRIAPSLPTISLGIGPFLDPSGNRLDSAKISAFCSQREIDLLSTTTKRELQRHKKLVSIETNRFSLAHDFVAAREFIFPLFAKWRTERKLKWNSSKEATQIRLAKKVDFTRHRDFINRLHGVAK